MSKASETHVRVQIYLSNEWLKWLDENRDMPRGKFIERVLGAYKNAFKNVETLIGMLKKVEEAFKGFDEVRDKIIPEVKEIVERSTMMGFMTLEEWKKRQHKRYWDSQKEIGRLKKIISKYREKIGQIPEDTMFL